MIFVGVLPCLIKEYAFTIVMGLSQKAVKRIACIGACFFIVSLGFIWRVSIAYEKSIHTLSDLPQNTPSLAIVFGAAVWKDHQPCPVLYDRVVTAVALYQSGYVKKLLLTGDHSKAGYNEPQVMHDLAVTLGVPSRDIILDFAGRNTFASCLRAKKVFGIKEAIFVSQGFHLPRILYISDAMGIKGIGVKADRRNYPLTSRLSWAIRESLALLKAWVNLHLWHSNVILGEP